MKQVLSFNQWSNEAKGLFLGFLGVVTFGITLPMTRLAVGDNSDPQLDPLFVTAGRASIAGILSIFYIIILRSKRPSRHHIWPLIVCALGTAIGWPIFIAIALRSVHAMHAAVITGILPLSSAIAGAIYFRQRPSFGFWACTLFGCFSVMLYAAMQGGGQLVVADLLLVLAVISTGIGYVGGTIVSKDLPAPDVICWVLVIALPVSLPFALYSMPNHVVTWQAWGGFTYVTLFSMWLGFFVWYRGLVLGGMVRVSQIQLLQPFVSVIAAVPLLGESLDFKTVGFLLLVMATVFVGRKMPVGQPKYRN